MTQVAFVLVLRLYMTVVLCLNQNARLWASHNAHEAYLTVFNKNKLLYSLDIGPKKHMNTRHRISCTTHDVPIYVSDGSCVRILIYNICLKRNTRVTIFLCQVAENRPVDLESQL